ncbi:MAG: prepilin-type N-terminal cleavage/methylation domain-containing protein [Puniceicoccales bacterium]|nr:prepilin-type N-terminal cleavage/methylation domain-containing protein [Puniceicoccales bacterium]
MNKNLPVRRNAFSLIEMLLALALSGSVLLASVSLMTTFVELWEREAVPDWEKEGVVVAKKFLENSLRESYIRLDGMYTTRLKSLPPQAAKPYFEEHPGIWGAYCLYWWNFSTPPFIANPHGKFIKYHLEYDEKKRRVRLHYQLENSPSTGRSFSRPSQASSGEKSSGKVTLFRHCTDFRYAYYSFDSDKWDLTLQPVVNNRNRRESPQGFHFQFEDKTQLFIYLQKHAHSFDAPTAQAKQSPADTGRISGGPGASGKGKPPGGGAPSPNP